MDRLRVVTLCSGYDAQCLALERLRACYDGFDYELVSWAEVDRYAIMAHDALFPQWRGRNIGDITSCDWSCIGGGIDLLTYSTPCQSISSAGRQEGLRRGSGTASSVIWCVLDAIDVLRPKYLLMENVKALVSRKFIGDFHEWQLELSRRGYTNFAKVLNAKDYGVPQNRERIFMVSILDYDGEYHFPEPFPLGRRLKDVLEKDVDEKYFLSRKVTDTYIKRNQVNKYKGNGFKFEPADGDCVASSGLTMPGSRPCDNYIKVPIACDRRFGDVQCLTPKRTEYGKQVRKKYESGELKESRHNMRQLEQRTDGLGATRVKVIANLYEGNRQGGRIIDANAISPTIGANTGGNLQPKIIQRARGFNKGGEHEISPTISSNSWECNNILSEPKILSYTRDANGKVMDRHIKDIANTIHCKTGLGGNTDSFVVEDYRIRKLTPREIFRLMDVDDADIDKIQAAGISRSQQYKLAGNSIVTNVLFHIFRKLFIYKGNESEQLTLF